MYEAIQERIQDYERAILEKLREMEREECGGKEPPEFEEQGESPSDPQARRGTAAPSVVPSARRGSDRGIDAIGVETVQAVVSAYGTDLSRFQGSSSHRLRRIERGLDLARGWRRGIVP